MKEQELPKYNKKSEFRQKLEQKQTEGWTVLGEEHLTKTQFEKETCLFKEIPDQTEEQIIEKYRENLAKQAPGIDFDIELVLNEDTEDFIRLKKLLSPAEYQDAKVNITPEKKIYVVIAKKK